MPKTAARREKFSPSFCLNCCSSSLWVGEERSRDTSSGFLCVSVNLRAYMCTKKRKTERLLGATWKINTKREGWNHKVFPPCSCEIFLALNFFEWKPWAEVCWSFRGCYSSSALAQRRKFKVSLGREESFMLRINYFYNYCKASGGAQFSSLINSIKSLTWWPQEFCSFVARYGNWPWQVRLQWSWRNGKEKLEEEKLVPIRLARSPN